MEVYFYDADIYCDECGAKLRERITAEGHAPADPSDQRSYDSHEFPKGPETDGGGEADTPQNCAACGCHLKNNLTTDGVEYVLEHLDEAVRTGDATDIERDWAASLKDYSLSTGDKARLELFNTKFPPIDRSGGQIWIRIGDDGDYHTFRDDLDCAISFIKDSSPGKPFRNYCKGGIQTENYPGNNYISIYWGDSRANLIAELTQDEAAQVFRALDQ